MYEKLDKYKIILASNSPRRQELLSQMGLDFTVVSREGFNETYPPRLTSKWVPEYLAKKKADSYEDLIKANTVLIAADTVVLCNKNVMGKPRTEYEARGMLKKLHNGTHRVITGVCIKTARQEIIFSVKTKVTFGVLSDEMINYYIENFKPFDKAGAYGIQEWIGLVGIEHIEGSYTNVMGLPTQRLYKELRQLL